MKPQEVKARIKKAFAVLRKGGVYARASFSCCEGCAGYEIRPLAEAAKATGYAYYHRQDNGDLLINGRSYISFNTLKPGFPAWDCGKMVVMALHAQGLETDWSGSSNQRIRVKGPAPKKVVFQQG